MKKRYGGGSRNNNFPGKAVKKVDRSKEIEEQLRIQRALAVSSATIPADRSAFQGYVYDEKTDRYYKGDKAQSQPETVQRKNHEKDNLISFLRHRETGTRYYERDYELLSIAHFVTLAEKS